MGRIGATQQRYEVLPVPAWDITDLIAEWRTEAPVEPVAGSLAGTRGTCSPPSPTS